MRKLVRLMCLVMAVLTVVTPVAFATDAEVKTTAFDLMLVVDDTGSMKNNDKHEVAQAALQSFMDIIPDTGSRVGIATFDDGIMTSQPIIEIDTDEDREIIKKFAQTELTREGLYTDLPTALYFAVQQLQNIPQRDSPQAIIALSDGDNDLSNPRLEERSNENYQNVMNAGIPVYVIHLNALGNKETEKYMEGIASATGGKFKSISTGDEISETLLEIAKDMYDYEVVNEGGFVGSVGPEAQEWNVTLEDGLFEANLELTHTAELQVQIFGPDGNEIPMDRDHGISSSSTNSENEIKTIIKLFEPTVGDYKLQMVSPNTVQYVRGEMILNKEIFVKLTASALGGAANAGETLSVEPGETIEVKAELMKGNELYTDLDFANLTALALLDNQSTEMTKNETDYTCTLTVPDTSDARTLELKVAIKGKNDFNRSSDPLSVAVAASHPEPSEPSEPPEPASPKIPIWVFLVGAALLMLVIIIILRIVLPPSPPLPPSGTLKVKYYENGHYTWEKFVNPRSYATNRRPMVPLGLMLREQRDHGEVPEYFDQLVVGGCKDPSQVLIKGNLGTEAEPEPVNTQLKVDTGMETDTFDSFGPEVATIRFPDGSYVEFTFTLS